MGARGNVYRHFLGFVRVLFGVRVLGRLPDLRDFRENRDSTLKCWMERSGDRRFEVDFRYFGVLDVVRFEGKSELTGLQVCRPRGLGGGVGGAGCSRGLGEMFSDGSEFS